MFSNFDFVSSVQTFKLYIFKLSSFQSLKLPKHFNPKTVACSRLIIRTSCEDRLVWLLASRRLPTFETSETQGLAAILAHMFFVLPNGIIGHALALDRATDGQLTKGVLVVASLFVGPTAPCNNRVWPSVQLYRFYL